MGKVGEGRMDAQGKVRGSKVSLGSLKEEYIGREFEGRIHWEEYIGRKFEGRIHWKEYIGRKLEGRILWKEYIGKNT